MSDYSGGYLTPGWFAEGKPAPKEPSPWGEIIDRVRVYEGDSELRFGYRETHIAVIRVSNECGCGAVEINLRDLLYWIEENTGYLEGLDA